MYELFDFKRAKTVNKLKTEKICDENIFSDNVE